MLRHLGSSHQRITMRPAPAKTKGQDHCRRRKLGRLVPDHEGERRLCASLIGPNGGRPTTSRGLFARIGPEPGKAEECGPSVPATGTSVTRASLGWSSPNDREGEPKPRPKNCDRVSSSSTSPSPEHTRALGDASNAPSSSPAPPKDGASSSISTAPKTSSGNGESK